MRLGAVLNNRNAMPLGVFMDRGHVCHPPVEMGDNQRIQRAENIVTQFGGAEVMICRIDVNVNGSRANRQRCNGSIHPRVGDRSHPRTRLDADRSKSQFDRVSAVPDRYAVAAPAVRREFCFKFFDLWAKDVGSAADDPGCRCPDTPGNGWLVAGKIVERDI